MAINLPLVTIAIPTFNRPDFVLQAIESALNQTYHNVEVIVADNSAEDDTERMVRTVNDSRLRYHRHDRNIGFSANWNYCLSMAAGEYFLLLSDDDLLEPTAIEQLAAPFFAPDGAEVAFVYGRVNIEETTVAPSPVGPFSETVPAFTKEFFAGRRSIYPCSTLFRTEEMRELGGYDEARYNYALDAAIWVGTGFKRQNVIFVRDIVGKYRMHPGNLTSTASCRIWIDGLNNLFKLAAEMVAHMGMTPDDVLHEEKGFIGRLLYHLLKKNVSTRNIDSVFIAMPYIGARRALSLAASACFRVLK